MASQTDSDGEDPSTPVDPPASRAAGVLDALVREQAPGSGDRFGLAWQDRGRWLRGLHPGAILAAVLAVAVVVAVVVWRRPAPIEDRLPIAATGTASDAASNTAGAEEPAAGQGGNAGSLTTTTALDGPAPDGPTAPGGPTELVVHVAGAVAAPGVVRLGAGTRVTDAVSAAGGLRADADPDRINLAAPLTDGQRVVVPILGQPVPVEVLPSGSAAGPGSAGASGTADGSPAALIDINTATESQLEELPGVGPATAAAIVAHRESEGAFATVDSLLDVRGIGEAKLDALRDLVTVGGAP